MSEQAPESTSATPRRRAASSGWRREGGDWRLPLYEYPVGLDRDIREFLPVCFAEWIGEAFGRTGRANETLRFAPPSVTLWTPNVLIVSQRARTRIGRDTNIFDYIDRLAAKRYPALWEVVDQALGAALEHPLLCKLVPTVQRELLWVVGTGFPTDAAGADPRDVKNEGDETLAASPGGNTPHRVFVKDLVTVAVPTDLSRRSRTDRQMERAAVDFEKLMTLQNLVWAVAINYDRSLLLRIAEKDVDIERRRLGEVEDEGRQLVSLYHVVASFRASLGSMEIHLQRQAYEYWHTLNSLWGFDNYLESISGKMDALAELHREVTAAVSSRRAQRLGVAAFGFTALGVITVGMAIVGFIVKDVDAFSVGVVTGVVLLSVLAIIAAVVFWLLGIREPGTRRAIRLGEQLRRPFASRDLPREP